jgi:hypothetical protein
MLTILSLFLALNAPTQAAAEVISQEDEAEVMVGLADRALTCFSKDEDGNGIEEFAMITLRPERLLRSPLVLHGHYFAITVKQNGAEHCRLVKEIVLSADPGHPGAGPYLYGKGWSLVELTADKLTERASIVLSSAGNPKHKLTFTSVAEAKRKKE